MHRQMAAGGHQFHAERPQHHPPDREGSVHLQHPHIISFKGVFLTNKHLALVMELAEVSSFDQARLSSTMTSCLGAFELPAECEFLSEGRSHVHIDQPTMCLVAQPARGLMSHMCLLTAGKDGPRLSCTRQHTPPSQEEG